MLTVPIANMQKHTPSDRTRQLVRKLAARLLHQEDIASVVGIDPKTLRLRYRKELDWARTVVLGAASRNIARMACGDDEDARELLGRPDQPIPVKAQLDAAKFLLNARGGWKQESVTEIQTHDENEAKAHAYASLRTGLERACAIAREARTSRPA